MKDTDNTFKWTPEFENEFVKWCKKNKYNNLLDAFIKSKQPPLSKDKERIEVSRIGIHDNFMGNKSDSFWYQFCTSKPLNIASFPPIQRLIESALNEDTVVGGIEEAGIAAVKISEQLNPKLTSREQAIFIAGFQECIKWQKPKTDTVVEDKGLRTGIMSQMDMYQMGYKDGAKYGNPDNKPYTGKEYVSGNPISRDTWEHTGKDSKEWEILTWLSPTGEVATLISGGIEGNLKAGYTIRSVRRLSDNTVFSVGDEVYVTCSDGKGFRDTINHFTFTGGVDIIDVYFKDQLHTTFGIHWLNIAKPAPTQTVTDNSDVACLSITDIKEVMPKYTYELFKKDFENKLNQKLKTHTP